MVWCSHRGGAEPVRSPKDGEVNHGHPGETPLQGKRHLDHELSPWECGTAQALGRMLGTWGPWQVTVTVGLTQGQGFFLSPFFAFESPQMGKVRAKPHCEQPRMNFLARAPAALGAAPGPSSITPQRNPRVQAGWGRSQLGWAVRPQPLPAAPPLWGSHLPSAPS